MPEHGSSKVDPWDCPVCAQELEELGYLRVKRDDTIPTGTEENA